MEIDVENIEQRPNLLLRRTEVHFRVTHEGETTPRRESLREALAELMNVKKDQVIIDHIAQEFGSNECRCYAKVYKQKELALKLEREYVLKRNNLAKPKKTPGKPKEGGAEDAGEAAASANGGGGASS